MRPPLRSLPSSPRRSFGPLGRTAKRNDVPPQAAARPPTGLLAHAQLNLPGVGVFGVGVYATEDKRMARAVFYRHVGGATGWETVGDGTFDAGRLWLWTALEPEDEIGLVILRGLNQALLSTPFARDRVARIALTSQRFHGDHPPTGPLADPLAEATRVVIARKSCARPGKAPDPTPIAKGLFEDLCYQEDGRFAPAAPGSGCDQLLSAVRRTTAPPCNLLPSKLDCPRRVSREDLAMAVQSHGKPPFDSSRPHEPGSIPCCVFHPTMQALLALRRTVTARVMATPGATWEDAARAIEEAEEAHPLRAAWAACHEEARQEAEGEMVSRARSLATAGTTKDARMSLFIALYHAMKDRSPDASSLLGELQRDDPTMWDFELDNDAQNLLTEHIHPYAHESGNPAYVMWTHKLLKRDAAGAVACTYTQRAQASRARHQEAMKASKPAPRRK